MKLRNKAQAAMLVVFVIILLASSLSASANYKNDDMHSLAESKECEFGTEDNLSLGVSNFVYAQNGSEEPVNRSGPSLNFEILAAQVLSFDKDTTLTAFKNIGSRKNVYVLFTGLPEGGKLYYNWRTSSQEEAKTGTAYYIDAAEGEKQLRNVVFVPSYATDKMQSDSVAIPMKVVDATGWRTTGMIHVKVNHAAGSTHFSDVVNPIYADSVDFLFNAGIARGTSGVKTAFAPDASISRAELVTFLWRAAGSPAPEGGNNPFVDVKADAYYYEAVLWADQNEIVIRRTATKFAPDANVTHQELLFFLHRYNVKYHDHFDGGSYILDTTDNPEVAEWAELAVKWAEYKGILNDNNILFNANSTRATLALWLHRMLTL